MTRKTHKLRKVLTLAACAVLLVSVSIMGTIAYLTSTDAVTNTFTVGQVGITLDEADVNTDGTYVTTVDNRVDANTYHLLPGHEYIKDPTVHVDADSEDSWLFVKVENGIEDIEDATNSIESQMLSNGWTIVEGETNVYAYKETVSAGDNIPVFGTFKIANTVENADLDDYAGKTVTVTAYAVQEDGFDTAAAAWNATFGAPAASDAE